MRMRLNKSGQLVLAAAACLLAAGLLTAWHSAPHRHAHCGLCLRHRHQRQGRRSLNNYGELADSTSPYNFNNIPIHILGSIYERFLGKVISDSGRVVEKPEVRKAGGVYYTPEYIVRYIVENTVGKLIAGKSPAQIAEMRFADIACGSGSFLLGVYDLLLRTMPGITARIPARRKKAIVSKRDGLLHLSLQKKRDILVNNIYGVDIDRQAVEVAQLSLYLKLLEDETIGSTSEFQTEFHFTLLPSLDKNIVCGNSLIEPDILDNDNFSAEEQKKINPLDYTQRFPRIFRRKAVAGELHDAPTPISDYTMPGVPLHGAFSYKKKKDAKVSPRAVQEFEGGFDAIVGNLALHPHPKNICKRIPLHVPTLPMADE